MWKVVRPLKPKGVTAHTDQGQARCSCLLGHVQVTDFQNSLCKIGWIPSTAPTRRRRGRRRTQGCGSRTGLQVSKVHSDLQNRRIRGNCDNLLIVRLKINEIIIKLEALLNAGYKEYWSVHVFRQTMEDKAIKGLFDTGNSGCTDCQKLEKILREHLSLPPYLCSCFCLQFVITQCWWRWWSHINLCPEFYSAGQGLSQGCLWLTSGQWDLEGGIEGCWVVIFVEERHHKNLWRIWFHFQSNLSRAQQIEPGTTHRDYQV